LSQVTRIQFSNFSNKLTISWLRLTRVKISRLRISLQHSILLLTLREPVLLAEKKVT
jgi:hypothetical protein